MAYVILVNDDDSLYGSHKERIMQRQKLVNSLIFVVNPIYKGIDMTDASVVLEYVLPVSREYKTVNLILDDEMYNNCFLQYKLPFDTDLSSQAGSLELQLTFVKTEMLPNGAVVQRVRKTSSTIIEIVPITAWSDIIPDAALSSLDQRLIKLDAQMRGINDYMNVLNSNQVDNFVYDNINETIQLSSNGKPIGDKVFVKDMLEGGIPVVELSSGNNSNTDNDDRCDCGCEDNVVDFGDYSYADNNIEDGYDVVDF